ncbi:hypothetical protein KL942_002620 [Ogataea angusta]|uniref:Uncharacterized protein n=1 Tax=Pichia angusta TaxID=870730 RepID=A0AAN6DHZ4_PICAN|nr:uncharacterized protein KL928_002412 [Ogataea angusta]KAG7819738.1 hypothetical protein KL928_002412 [Ogataea angusta]KAG7840669.1 hypothetical protein KL942_002620 [Ogataea angusta]KAG7849047.1 hypothetical protein KL941_001865 [Ogataea angusta]KAG7850577.1 hypothetical protein KL940_002137 [Ogataea angusta]KAG7861174.1 hypothetical protein KL919_001908 [Ogataea angusta]
MAESHRLYVKGKHISYQRSKHVTNPNTSLIKIEGVANADEAKFYLGKRIAYVYRATKEVRGSKIRCIWGKVTRTHGNNGLVRAQFKNNLPAKTFGASYSNSNLFYISTPSHVAKSLHPIIVVLNSFPAMIPWEGLWPFGLMLTFFGLSGGAMNALFVNSITRSTESSKSPQLDDNNDRIFVKPRFNTDQWDKYLAIRDLRLTGSLRGQQAEPEAHESFETNSLVFASEQKKPWVVRKHFIMRNTPSKWMSRYDPEQSNNLQSMNEDFLRGMKKS